MSMGKMEIINWLTTLPEDSGIYIDDGGMALKCIEDPGAYLEIGGYTPPLYSIGREENEFWPVLKADVFGEEAPEVIATFQTRSLAEKFIQMMEEGL